MNRDKTGNKKVPEVKMTKTARMRMLKSNPLIKYQIEKTNNTDMAKNLDLDTMISMNKSVVSELKSHTLTSCQEVKHNQKEDSKKVNQIPKIEAGPESKISKVKPNKFSSHKRKLVRRSVSAPRMNPKKDVMNAIKETQEVIDRSISVENIPHNVTEAIVQPISQENQPLFACPSRPRKSLFNSTPCAPVDLRRKLTDWLVKKEKNISSFKHLKCFGVRKIDIVEEENKENFETSCIRRDGSYEDLKIDNPLYSSKGPDDTSIMFAPSDLEKVARGAVKDLNCLISEGYPIEQCEAWLKVIRNKCPEVIEDPQYWECRATIEQLRGDIGSAVECYKTAVVQGAEVTSVEQSLDQLLQKFKLLDIDSSAEQKEAQKERVKVMQDFKNVFTSMIIKFAIQEKTIKNSVKNKISTDTNVTGASNRLLVTPVRRSTRLSRSLYTSTPGTKICSSIQELNSDEKHKMVFQPNAALLDM
ncbi:uncharacterized protein LOC123316615 [Coccinella septempunctata]|uniref:uncharacterized protein LOC123316615 n=1 Tax=Coccinella septempunctata TaxID=41139 RepID=UPI001D0761B1|nr:uncharacterized protein LOC123316615 [Coccinella septempunctata]